MIVSNGKVKPEGSLQILVILHKPVILPIDTSDCNDLTYTFSIRACPAFITETTNAIIAADNSANISITTNGRVVNGDIEYSAGQKVDLTKDFEVEVGAVFHAFIAPCN